MELGEPQGVLEGLLCAAGRPVPLRALARSLGMSKQEVELALRQYEADLLRRDRGICIRRRSNGIRIEVKPQYLELVQRAYPERSARSLHELKNLRFWRL